LDDEGKLLCTVNVEFLDKLAEDAKVTVQNGHRKLAKNVNACLIVLYPFIFLHQRVMSQSWPGGNCPQCMSPRSCRIWSVPRSVGSFLWQSIH
jgi:hypothetical protein